MPVTVTLMGRGDRGAVPLARLAWPLAMVLAGIGCINTMSSRPLAARPAAC
ncbi:MAG: FIG006442: Integral membrane protein [uncultured Paraburkholderia sp.]|nr:MAG: FIG006442: Integral membrane protein [uncultured Paraburkholderia sp.]CAH2914445.1 MAG: FIG006442: Integral membrane protein [uncultured Paraburkholderia sp.]